MRLILLTGCRSGEILRLRWDEANPDRLALTSTKTGLREVLLSHPARKLLTARKASRASAYVFPSARICAA